MKLFGHRVTKKEMKDIVDSLIQKAVNGDVEAARVVLDFVDMDDKSGDAE